MRDVPASMEAIWASGDYTGARRPMARVTVQHPMMNLREYAFPAPQSPEEPTCTGVSTEDPTATTVTPADPVFYRESDDTYVRYFPPFDPATAPTDTYADFLFSGLERPRELPNVKSVEWQRSIDSDSATATITFFNMAPLPLGVTALREYDMQGFYTYNRGQSTFSSRWGQQVNEWANLLMPDNVLRTYEGYGFDGSVIPERDPNLVLTGIWRIDDVSLSSDGTISVTARDLGSLLIDQMVFPPVVPEDFYPLSFHASDKASGVVDPQLDLTRVQINDYTREANILERVHFGPRPDLPDADTDTIGVMGRSDNGNNLYYALVAPFDLAKPTAVSVTINFDDSTISIITMQDDQTQTTFVDSLELMAYTQPERTAAPIKTAVGDLGSVRFGFTGSTGEVASQQQVMLNYSGAYSDFGGWQANGSARVLYDGSVLLTDGGTNQTGTIWSPTTVQTAGEIEINFTVNLESGGDGITLAIAPASTPVTAIGGAASGLGLSGVSALGVAFSTYRENGLPIPVTFSDSSNRPRGFAGGGNGTEPLDGSTDTYWLSGGNTSYKEARGVEWYQVDVPADQYITAVRVTPYNFGYWAYVSVFMNNAWLTYDPTEVVPYDPTGDPVDREARLPYVSAQRIDSGNREYFLALPRVLKGITAIRVSFSKLRYDTAHGGGTGEEVDVGRYRAGIRNLRVNGFKPSGLAPTPQPQPVPPEVPVTTILVQDVFSAQAEETGSLGTPPASLCRLRTDPEDYYYYAEFTDSDFPRDYTYWLRAVPSGDEKVAGRIDTADTSGDPADRAWAFYPFGYWQQIVECTIIDREIGNGPARWILGLRMHTINNELYGIAVAFDLTHLSVYTVTNGNYTFIGRHDYPDGVDITTQRLRVEVEGNHVTVWYRGLAEGGVWDNDVKLDLRDARFGNANFGYDSGFAADNRRSAYNSWQVRLYDRNTLTDSFKRTVEAQELGEDPTDEAIAAEAARQRTVIATSDSGQIWQPDATPATYSETTDQWTRGTAGLAFYVQNGVAMPNSGTRADGPTIWTAQAGTDQACLVRMQQVNISNGVPRGDVDWFILLRVNRRQPDGYDATKLVQTAAGEDEGSDDDALTAVAGDPIAGLVQLQISSYGRLTITTVYDTDDSVRQVVDGYGNPLIDANPNGGGVARYTGTFAIPAGKNGHPNPLVGATISNGRLTVSIDNVVLYDEDHGFYENQELGTEFGIMTTSPYGAFDEVEVVGSANARAFTYTVREFQTLTPSYIEAGAGFKPGDYEDYTDIIKLVCGWAGFHWPLDAFRILTDGTVVNSPPDYSDYKLGDDEVGRIWGDFEDTGTKGVADLQASEFDKKSLMDIITYVRDIIGYLFYIDETGAVVWRYPNILTVGNTVSTYSQNPGRTTTLIELDESKVISQLQAALSSRNVRELVFVASTDGSSAATSAGFNPNPTGVRRVAGWLDQNFASTTEAQVMADLITLRQLFTYRSDQVRVPGLPKIQIDDQVRIFERTTSEGFVHYVQGVSSSLDLESGEYWYDLQTNWLGEDPLARWAFDINQLSEATQMFLRAALGAQQDATNNSGSRSALDNQ